MKVYNTLWKAVLLCFLLCPLYAFAQTISKQTIDLQQIPHKKVRRYIADKEINKLENYSAIKSSWNDTIDPTGFCTHEKIFYLNDEINHVWECYKVASPAKSWNGRFVKFALLILKPTNSVVYTDCVNFSEIDTGQVYFLDLKLMKGLFNVPVAFEIIRVDADEKIIEFSYIDGNKSQGKQVLHFIDNGNGTTQISHLSYFKSNSGLRDTFFYPYYHTKIIRQFHRNMREMVLSAAQNKNGASFLTLNF